MNQNDLSDPPSPASSAAITPTASPLSSKRARETSISSDAEAQRPISSSPSSSSPSSTTTTATYDTDDEQLENAVAGWDCNDTAPLEIPDLSPAEQIEYLESLKTTPLVDAETWYLVAATWLARWKQYCRRLGSNSTNTQLLGAQTSPGPVDNSSLLDDNSRLSPDLLEESDYVCVPEVGWQALEKWYGTSDTPIPRQVITEGQVIKETCIEIYPTTFKVYMTSSAAQSKSTVEKSPTITLSRKTLIQDMKQTLLNAFDLPQDANFDLWRLEEDPPYTLSPFVPRSILNDAERIDLDQNGSKTISDLSLGTGTLVLDLSSSSSNNLFKGFAPLTGTIGSPPFSSSSSPSSSIYNGKIDTTNDFGSSSWMSKSTPPVVRQQGTCGLSNLGNTCFMNSALQCLSNTMELTKWFLAGNYKQDLNRDNPLGMNGEIAENYGALIEKLWSGTVAHIAPRDFKYTISRFNPTFTGYQQHDSQELLAFLLDGLHEDMNRILKKPYIEMPDFDDMTDEEIAKTSWNYHKARNDSVIVDLFQGQFKSRLICNVCQKVSVTFDPFMYLSLPLPIQKKRKTKLVYVPYDPSITPQRMTITLDKDASFKALKDTVAKQTQVDPSTLLVVEIFNDKIYKLFPDYDLVATVGLSDLIYVYQLPAPVPSVPRSTGQRQARFSIRSRLGSSALGSTNGDYTADRHHCRDDDDDDGERWIIFPVYCATTNDAGSQYSYEQFGGPILLAIQAKDATCPDNIYKLIAKHVERYTIMKLFEEIRRPSQASITSPLSSESPSTPINATLPNGDIEDKTMDVDAVDAIDQQQQPKLIRTAAAVTAAGGRHLEPINNLFTMKVFRESHYGDMDDIVPVGMTTWRTSSFEDLKERYMTESAEREAYEKAKQDGDFNVCDNDSMQVDSSKTPESPAHTGDEGDEDDDYENDVVPDVASEWDQQDTAMTLAETTQDDDDTSSTHRSASSSMIFEQSSSNEDKFTPIQSASPAPSSPSSPSMISAPAPPPPHPRQRALPPRTVIRQGEGIVIEWRLKKAQEVFGVSTENYGNSKVNDAGWKEIDNVLDPNAVTVEKENKKQVTLMDCLDEFTKEEQLSEEDLWYCPQCKEHQRATKKFDIWNLPEIMVVHLKRFSHTRILRDKIDDFIDFPMEALDMTDRVLGASSQQGEAATKEQFIYDLYAVDNHFGGMGGGHYTAYAQNWQDGEWYNFDDSHVTKVEQKDAKTKAAYLLFYKRRRPTVDDVGGKPAEEDVLP